MLTAAYLGNRTIGVRPATAVHPSPGTVRIRVAYVGLCGTDLHIAHGDMDARVSTPLVFGHEMSGTIDAIGEGVDGWSLGDKATVMPLLWDGTCPACLAGNTHICQNLTFVGIDSPGALQSLWNVPASILVRVPDSAGLKEAALIEPVAVAVHDVRRGKVAQGDLVVVLGGGPIGTLIASVATRFGAQVAVIEPDAARRAMVGKLGFLAPDPSATDVVAWVEEWTHGAGADVVFEVSGAAAAVLTATAVAKVRGTIVVVAIHSELRPVNLQRVFWRELLLVGARVYERADFETAVELIGSGAIPTDSLISKVVPLGDIAEAIHDLEGGRAMKILIDVQDGQPEEALA
jgi:2-desacetyl-2-hydroxyethyl bacteriochlorophyllide A dehydrogenase